VSPRGEECRCSPAGVRSPQARPGVEVRGRCPRLLAGRGVVSRRSPSGVRSPQAGSYGGRSVVTRSPQARRGAGIRGGDEVSPAGALFAGMPSWEVCNEEAGF